LVQVLSSSSPLRDETRWSTSPTCLIQNQLMLPAHGTNRAVARMIALEERYLQRAGKQVIADDRFRYQVGEGIGDARASKNHVRSGSRWAVRTTGARPQRHTTQEEMDAHPPMTPDWQWACTCWLRARTCARGPKLRLPARSGVWKMRGEFLLAPPPVPRTKRGKHGHG
jgi:hypothetical protein